MKQGHVMKNWNSRQFVMEKGWLRYYVSEKKDYPYGINEKGKMYLKGVSVVEDKTQVILKAVSGRGADGHDELVLDIKYPSERADWIAEISKHIAYANATD